MVAAKLFHKIGCDFIDVKQCHRYLLSELLAAKNRPGEYGGSLENRTRLVRNIVGRIRDEVPGLIIGTRINAYDGIPYHGVGDEFIGQPCPHDLPLETAFGTDPHDHLREDLSEPVQLAKWLREWGVSLINVSAGNPYSNPHVVRPAEFAPVDGYNTPEHPLLGVLRHFRIASAIQAAVPDIPVVGSGYSWLQDFALHAGAANVTDKSVAIVGMGRATLSHPDFAKAVQETGHMNRKQICRTFSYCTNLMRSKDHPLGQYPTGCPPFDKEVYGPLWKEAEAKLKGDGLTRPTAFASSADGVRSTYSETGCRCRSTIGFCWGLRRVFQGVRRAKSPFQSKAVRPSTLTFTPALVTVQIIFMGLPVLRTRPRRTKAVLDDGFVVQLMKPVVIPVVFQHRGKAGSACDEADVDSRVWGRRPNGSR